MAFKLFGQKSQEEKFWNWFVKNQSTYYTDVGNKKVEEQIFNELSSQLVKINEELVFEFSPIHENGIRELTISSEGIAEVFPIIENLIEKAPELENWQFNAFRQRIPGDNFEIQFGDLKIGYSDLYFKFGYDNDKIGIELNIRNYDGEASTQNAIYILLDGLIGEYDVTTSIGWIEWVKLDEDNISNLHPITHLRKVIDDNKE